jgi:hypothetical protein
LPAVADATGGTSGDNTASGSIASTESEIPDSPAAEVVELDSFRKK